MVAFKDFIKEASDLRPAEVNKYAGRPDDRIPVFLNKVSKVQSLQLQTVKKLSLIKVK